MIRVTIGWRNPKYQQWIKAKGASNKVNLINNTRQDVILLFFHVVSEALQKLVLQVNHSQFVATMQIKKCSIILNESLVFFLR